MDHIQTPHVVAAVLHPAERPVIDEELLAPRLEVEVPPVRVVNLYNKLIYLLQTLVSNGVGTIFYVIATEQVFLYRINVLLSVFSHGKYLVLTERHLYSSRGVDDGDL